jgi:hypothetical protein
MAKPFHHPITKVAGLLALALLLLAGIQRTGQTAPPTQDINVVNTPSVNVVSMPATPLATKDAALGQTPFQAHAIASFEPGTNGAFAAIAVPSGKRLVIENVSLLASLNNGTALRYATIVTLDQGGGSEAEHYLVASPQGSVPGVADYFTANHALRAYAVGAITLRVFRTDTLGFGQVNVTVTGTLVNAS